MLDYSPCNLDMGEEVGLCSAAQPETLCQPQHRPLQPASGDRLWPQPGCPRDAMVVRLGWASRCCLPQNHPGMSDKAWKGEEGTGRSARHRAIEQADNQLRHCTGLLTRMQREGWIMTWGNPEAEDKSPGMACWGGARQASFQGVLGGIFGGRRV
jgi:hypothetical protein